MILVDQDDVLRGLKRCKRLAKQALLASGLTANPSFWTAQAEARRVTYDDLMSRIEEGGVELTYTAARHRYEELVDSATPEQTGERQALEMFFTIVGMGDAQGLPVEYVPQQSVTTS